MIHVLHCCMVLLAFVSVGATSDSGHIPVAPVAGGGDTPKAPCANSGSVTTATAHTDYSPFTTDCDNDGEDECGYSETYYPDVGYCDATVGLEGYCCHNVVQWSKKRTWSCNYILHTCSVVSVWANQTAYVFGQLEACSGTPRQNHPSCN